MEDKKLSEKESLELISSMIDSTRKNMQLGSGNTFLYYGYFTAFLSLTLYLLIRHTGNMMWSWGWFSLFIFWGIVSYLNHRNRPALLTYTDTVLDKVWSLIGSLFIVTAVILLLLPFIGYGQTDFALMLPLSLIYCAIGTSLTGIIINCRVTTYAPLAAFGLAIYMLLAYTQHPVVYLDWYLYFGIAFVIMMILPGHRINRKAKAVCSKN